MRPLSNLLLVLVLLVLAHPPAHAEPPLGAAADGLPGLSRLGLPESPPPGVGLTLSLGYGYTGDVLDDADAHHRTRASGALALRALPWLGVAVRFDGRYDSHAGDAGDDDGWVLDTRLEARASRALGDRLRLGVDLTLWLPSDRPFVPDAAGASIDLAGSASWRAAPRLALIARAGYRLDRSAATVDDPARLSAADRLGLGLADNDALLLGAGALYRLDGAELGAELSWDLLVGEGAPAATASPLRLGLGLRRPVGDGWVVQVGAEIALSERPPLMPDALVPVEPRFTMLVGATTRFGGRGPARLDGAGGGDDVEVRPDPPPPTRTVRGRLLDADGAPLAGVRVRAGEQSAVTDGEGRFELAGVPASVTELQIEASPPWAARTQPIAPGEGEAALGEVKLERATPPGQLRGVIRSLKGKPLAASVRVEPSGARVTAGADGQFQLDVPPGEYDVIIEADGYRMQKRHVVVVQEGVTVLNVELSPQ